MNSKQELVQLTIKELRYYVSVNEYFKEVCNVNDVKKMINIIEGTSNISLRILDWFVTKYSQKNTINLTQNNNDIFNVFISYKAQLKSYKKKYFDPFRRRTRIEYSYDKNNFSFKIFTTIGQLNFFRWLISNKILIYIENNLPHIIEAMNKANREDKKQKLNNNDKSLEHITDKTKTINLNVGDVYVDFD